MTNVTDGQVTAFVIEGDGTVRLSVEHFAGMSEVTLTPKMLAGIAEASAARAANFAEMVKRFPPDPEPRYYFRVQAPGRAGTLLTYYSRHKVDIGDSAILPSLRGRGGPWRAQIVGTGRGDYTGPVKAAINIEYHLSH